MTNKQCPSFFAFFLTFIVQFPLFTVSFSHFFFPSQHFSSPKTKTSLKLPFLLSQTFFFLVQIHTPSPSFLYFLPQNSRLKQFPSPPSPKKTLKKNDYATHIAEIYTLLSSNSSISQFQEIGFASLNFSHKFRLTNYVVLLVSSQQFRQTH